MNNHNYKVFVVEDEQDIAELVRYNLAIEGFNVSIFNSGEEGFQALLRNKPDLLILDLMLPGKNGYELCQNIRQNSELRDLPIIMVTAKGEESDIIKGLELGADDYITKPFSPKILLARVHAVLRRFEDSRQKLIGPEGIIEQGDMFIHPGRHQAKISGTDLELTRSEFQILYLLAKKPGWVFTRTQIVDAIRGENYAVTDRSIDFQMVGLRKKMGPAGELIETVRGVGYRFKEA